LTQPFKQINKDRLFYNRFEYAISFIIDEASALRDLSHEEIDLTIERRKEWREIAQQRWNNSSSLFRKQNILSRRRKEITDTTVKDLHTLAEILLISSADFKLVVSVNQGHVYTNDLTLLSQLDQLDFLTGKSYSRATINRPRNTIQLKNPQHQYRSYFKIIKITDDQKRNLINFLTNQRESVRISPALNRWITTSLTRTQDYFFIDHDELSWLTMLGLVRSGLIRKTQQIIPTK
jgi:hypothetical protein